MAHVRQLIHQGREEGGQNAYTYVCESAVNGREVGDEGEKSLEDLELYVYTLRHAVVDCLDDSSRDN